MSPQERKELNQLLLRLADGDRKAFDPLYENTWPIINRFAVKMVSNSIEAEDIAQLALMKVFNRSTEFRKDGDALSWILGITAFECKTARQKIRRRKEEYQQDDTLAEQADHSSSVEEQLIKKNLEDAIQDALKGLSSEEQETIRISIYETEKPNIPAATFRKRLQRALTSLKDTWRDQYE